MGTNHIKIQNPTFSYVDRKKTSDRAVVFSNLNLSFKTGKIYGLYGPNGSGKSTLLRVLSGELNLETGAIIGFASSNKIVKIGRVWQQYSESLLPWYSVAQNIFLGETLKGVSKDIIYNKAADIVRNLDLPLDIEKKAHDLSGGQQQMVSIARAFATDSKILLLDEPFSALDYKIKLSLISILRKITKEKNITVLIVSHDVDELIKFTDEILVFSPIPLTLIDTVDVNGRDERARNEVFKVTEKWLKY